MSNTAIWIDHVSKEYRLGMIGGGTLTRDLQSWWARKRGKEDPNRKLNAPDVKEKNARFLALSDIDLKINQGDSLGLIGHNGAGKSTLLKLIARITAPTSGTIYEKGRIASMLEVGTGFHPELTGRENVYLNGAILGMSRSEISKKMDEIVDFSEIETFIDTPVKRYSSGMYVKLAFAVAAHLEPDVLICDEVLAVGDVRFQQKCLGKMSEVASGGRTVIYVSHNMRTIEQLCSRTVCLSHGKVVFDGAVDKGIEYYMGDREAKKLEFELESLPRRRVGGAVKMTRLRLTGTTSCQYAMGEPVTFDLEWKAERNISDLCARMIVNTPTGQPVAMANSNIFANPKAGDSGLSHCSQPLDGLAPGEYQAKLLLMQRDGSGRFTVLDGLDDVFRFEIIDSPEATGGVWQTRLWGNTYLSAMTVR